MFAANIRCVCERSPHYKGPGPGLCYIGAAIRGPQLCPAALVGMSSLLPGVGIRHTCVVLVHKGGP